MAILTCRPRNRLSKERLRVFRHQQAQKARQARRVLDRNHQQLPKQARALFDPLAPAFTRPTYRRFALLAVAAILTLGGHTICNLLRCLAPWLPDTPPVITASSRAVLGAAGIWRGDSETSR